jgi:hypothetical protein
MTQQDYKIREGLIALMCVGDPIYHLGTNSYNDLIHHSPNQTYTMKEFHNPHRNGHINTVRKYIIAEILEDKILCRTIRTINHASFWQEINMIDEYNGELYIWNAEGWYGENEYEKRLERLALILDSPNLNYLD